jgi:hypothetical protein
MRPRVSLATPENAAKIVAVLNKFGFVNLSAGESDFTSAE